METVYTGMDLAQFIFAGAVIMIFVFFALWAFQTQRVIRRMEAQLRDFRELEPEGYDEETAVDTMSEGARIEADEELARQSDILEHGA